MTPMMKPRARGRAGAWTALFSGLGCALALAGASVASAQEAAPFQPVPALDAGTLRIWGQPYMSGVVKNWAEGFRKFHPEITIEPRLMGSDTGVPGLYSGSADIALMGRDPNITDENGFFRPKRYKFTRFELMNGSLATGGKSPALAVLVHRDNPVERLTLAQLAVVAGCGHDRQPLTWGRLGVTGAWADKPVHLYVPDIESGTGLFMLHKVTNDSRKLDWNKVTDFKDERRADGSTYPAFEQAADALKNDRYGIAVARLREATSDLKPVAIAAKDGGQYLLPSRETVIARTYPFARNTWAFIDQPPGKAIDPKVKEFLRYTLSREGQADVERDRGYLPLGGQVLAAQRGRLN